MAMTVGVFSASRGTICGPMISPLGYLGARKRRADLRRMDTAAKRGSVLSDSC